MASVSAGHMRHSKTNDQVNMQKRNGFLRTERGAKDTKKKLDERLASVLLGCAYKIGLDLGGFKFWNFDLGSNYWL